jgi:TatD DNase family protein
MSLIDSHAHLDFPQFDRDRDAVIRRAQEAGLVAIVNIGTNLASSRASVALAERYDFIYATVGIHPHDAETASEDTLEELRILAHHPKVVAIGEIGLDYYRDYSPRPAQRQAFQDQLALASALGRPVVIHSRDAHEDVLATLQDWNGTGVLHTYAAGPEHLDDVIAMGFFIGISGPVTFSKAERLRVVAKAVPLDRLLVETDCPYLSPEPHRGRRNEPAYVKHVAEAISQIRDESPERIASATTENTRLLFGLPRSRQAID